MKLPSILERKQKNRHKNDFGHVLVVAGSPTMLGAACLTALAAMRGGAGLTTAAVPREINLALQEKLPHVIMTLPLPQTKTQEFSFSAYKELLQSSVKFQSVALGPGLGRNPGTCRFIIKMISSFPLPEVVDADALYALSACPDALLAAPAPRILTPHAGEMARLTGLSRSMIDGDRRSAALTFARRYQCVLVLKGHRTVVADHRGRVGINRTGNSGMATAGSGDVLTGLIAALLAQGVPPFEAARIGVDWHGRAGDLAAASRSRRSMIATDIIDHLHLIKTAKGGVTFAEAGVGGRAGRGVLVC